jgi:3-deoxy-D-manno-octulosonic-acid transferase
VSVKLPAPILAYRAATSVLEPAAAGLLRWRERRGLEDPLRLAERQGFASRPRPEGPLAWLHGASIGETLSMLPLVEKLTERGMGVLVTSGTRTSAALLQQRLPPGALHQFVPLDVPRYVRRFLDHWQPNLALLAESEIWPNLVLELDARVVPLILVNGRMSDRSFRRWRRLPQAIEPLLQRFTLCLAQSRGDADRLAELGALRVSISGNLKFDVPAPTADPRAVAQLSSLLAGRAVWLAASTHPGEEELCAAAHRALAERFPGLLTIVAPRHPRRGADVADIAAEAGLTAALRSEGQQPARDTDIYVADTVGEMGLFYRVAPIAFMGGSLVRHGGQNPIEPAKLGAAILHGPHVHNFGEAYAALDRAGGARSVEDGEGLAHALDELLGGPARVRAMARAAGEAMQGLGGAVERTLRAIDPFISGVKLGARR